jgi:hypothetical protein
MTVTMAGSGTLLADKVGLKSDARWLLIERIVASQIFGRSSRSSQFLAYVSELTLTGRADEINEQNIGEYVFERTPGYDPGQDNIVRVQASRLRQKLETYFDGEGTAEELRVMIPKGGYVPRFVASQTLEIPGSEPNPATVPASQPSPAPVLEPTATASTPRPRRRRWLYAATGCFLLLNLFGIVYLHEEGPRASFSIFGFRFIVSPTNTANPLWAQIFEKKRPTLIVPGDSGLVLYESQADKTVTLAEYLSGDVQTVPQINPSATSDTPTNKTAYRYTTIVDLQLATRLLQLPEASLSQSEVRYARDLKLDDLKRENAVLIGDKSANPWVELFEQQMNFALDINRTNHNYVVTNRKPQPGEDALYSREPNGHPQRAYALVALLPNLDRMGSVLILEGTTMAGTEAASDFVFEGRRLTDLLHLYVRADGSLPHFEVLLETNVIGRGAAESKVLAYRIHSE